MDGPVQNIYTFADYTSTIDIIHLYGPVELAGHGGGGAGGVIHQAVRLYLHGVLHCEAGIRYMGPSVTKKKIVYLGYIKCLCVQLEVWPLCDGCPLRLSCYIAWCAGWRLCPPDSRQPPQLANTDGGWG